MFSVIKFALKSFLFVGVLGAGGAFAVNRIPSLRANVIEYVNPRVKEARLLNELDAHLTTVGNTLVRETVGASPAERSQRAQKVQEAIAEAQELIAEIDRINDDNSGLADGAIAKIIDIVVPSRTASPSPSPAVSTAASPGPSPVFSPSAVSNTSNGTSVPGGSTTTPAPCVP